MYVLSLKNTCVIFKDEIVCHSLSRVNYIFIIIKLFIIIEGTNLYAHAQRFVLSILTTRGSNFAFDVV